MVLSRRVAVTGIGVATPLGIGFAAFRQALREGKSGIRRLSLFDSSILPVHIGAEIADFDPKQFIDKKDRKILKMMARTSQFGVAGARLALDHGALAPGSIDPERLSVAFGTGTIAGEPVDLSEAARAAFDETSQRMDLRRWGALGLKLIPPMWMLNHVPNMSACHAAILNDARGPNNTITQSDAAGLLAMGEAVRVLQRDAADVVIAGGGDTHTDPVSVIRFCMFSELSRRNDAPEKACRPFDRDRDGQVLGEGAGVFLLEGLEHAKKRQAPIYGEIVGFASGFDRGRKGEALARVARAAMTQAEVEPRELDHVNAYAAGTIEGDAWEARGLRQAVGEVPVLALKSYVGNLGTASAGVELAASLAAYADNSVPGTLNCDNADPRCPVQILREPRPPRRPYVLKISCTELGHCAALVLKCPIG